MDVIHGLCAGVKRRDLKQRTPQTLGKLGVGLCSIEGTIGGAGLAVLACDAWGCMGFIAETVWSQAEGDNDQVH